MSESETETEQIIDDVWGKMCPFHDGHRIAILPHLEWMAKRLRLSSDAELQHLRKSNKELVEAVLFGLSRFCDPQNLLDDPAAVRFKEMGEAALTAVTKGREKPPQMWLPRFL